VSRAALALVLPAALLALLASACAATRPGRMPKLANAVVSQDFESYALRRVGLLPVDGRGLTEAQKLELQRALHGELAQSTPFEIVPLDGRDLAELELSEPHRRGWYQTRTIIGLTRRYSLDGLLFGTVTQERFYPPLQLSLSVDLVSSETGLVIWTGAVHLDAADPRVAEGLRTYYGSSDDPEGWRLALLSPERFARFAAFQIACLL
jgi:hypothetical protein